MSSTPSYLGGTPLQTLRRTWILRIVVGVPVLAALTVSGYLTFLALRERPPVPVATAVLSLLTLSFAGLLVWLLRREASLEVRLYPEGIEEVSAGGTKSLRWSEVSEVWIRAIGVHAGGLVGAGITAAVEAARKDTGSRLSESSTNITLRIVAPSGRIVLSSNYKGIVAALEEILRRVNPRLVEEKLRQARAGAAAEFGKVSISSAGLVIGRKQPIPLAELESLLVVGGRLIVKKKGKWLPAARVRAEEVPNLYVLTAVFAALSGAASKGTS